MLRQAQRMGAPRAVAICQSVNGALAFQARRWPESEEYLREAVTINRQLGTAFGEAIACERLAHLLTAQGRLEEGVAAIAEGLVAADHGKLRSHVLARLYGALARNRLAAGDLPAAVEALSLGLHMSEEHERCGTCETALLPVAVSITIAQGDLHAAAEYCRQLDAEAERYGSHTWRALACKARGELAVACGDTATALACYEAAQAGFLASGNEYEATQCHEALARLRQTPGVTTST